MFDVYAANKLTELHEKQGSEAKLVASLQSEWFYTKSSHSVSSAAVACRVLAASGKLPNYYKVPYHRWRLFFVSVRQLMERTFLLPPERGHSCSLSLPCSKMLVRCFENQLRPMTHTEALEKTHDLVSRSHASLWNHLHQRGFSEIRHSRDMMLSCFQGASTSCPSSASPVPESSFTCNLCTEVDHPSIQNCGFFPAETLILTNQQTIIKHPSRQTKTQVFCHRHCCKEEGAAFTITPRSSRSRQITSIPKDVSAQLPMGDVGIVTPQSITSCGSCEVEGMGSRVIKQPEHAATCP